jgi:DNA-binding transcriptional LysR family regulator
VDASFSKTLIQISEYGSITKAAEKMGYTQSGLSHTLNRVEDELGFKLFIRSKTGVTLTKEGKLLLPVAKEVEHSAEKLYETITSIQGIQKGCVTIGTFSSISMNILPPVLKAFGRDYPGIQIDLKEGSITKIREWIMDHTVDIGFTSIQEGDEFEYKILFEDPLLAVIPKDFELDVDRPFDVKIFEKYPFIMAAMEKGYDCDTERAVKENNLDLNIILSSNDDIAIISMVEYNLGLSILPELITINHSERVRTMPMKPYSCRMLGVGVDSFKNISPAALKFIEYSEKIIRKKKIKQ